MKFLHLEGDWQMQQQGSTEKLPATVPGCVHTDLLNAKKIDDPFIADNEKQLMWIGEKNWLYTRSFYVEKDMLGSDKILLVCEGLDTLATIKINGKLVGRTDNAFRTWRYDVGRYVRAGENQIEVLFQSTLPYVRKMQKHRSLFLTGVGHHRIDGSNQIRKSQCNYGWDWGPMCVTAGIWRGIRLEASETAHFTDVQVIQHHLQKGSVGLGVGMLVEQHEERSLAAKISIALDGENVLSQSISFVDGKADVRVSIPQPQLWWPNGMGPQPLYSITAVLYDASGKELDKWQKRVGLRTIELVTSPDKWGTSFSFSVNGKPFFAKGANWIPADTFVTRVTPDWYRHLIKSAADVHMNMLRVWGGGIYEDNAFYDLCDEYGICVWQDFMFACSAYPAYDETFMQTVEQEAVDNIKRLRHHPSIALWCGNNEIEQMHKLAIGKDAGDGKMTWKEYSALFDKLLPSLVKKHCPGTAYWPSSPHTPGKNRLDFNSPNEGDAHLWDVWHGRKPFEWYRTCDHRFNSEFGFQSFPEPSVVNNYVPKAERNITSYIMELHQRSGIGNDAIIQYMLSWFRLPTTFPHTLWLSQILQGIAIKNAVEHWRRKMPQGMGTLYWQLNDCWPVASWSSIDFPGNWKALHHMAKEFFAPLLVSAVEDPVKGSVEIHVTNDDLKTHEGEVLWQLGTTAGDPVEEGKIAVKVPSSKSRKIKTLSLKEHLGRLGGRNLLLWLQLMVGGEIVSQNLITFVRPKHLLLENPRLSAEVVETGKNIYDVSINASRPALWVWSDIPGTQATYSDRFFHLDAGETKEITIKPWKSTTLQQIEKKLQVFNLLDTYQ